jgi:hypothetical protein
MRCGKEVNGMGGRGGDVREGKAELLEGNGELEKRAERQSGWFGPEFVGLVMWEICVQ